MQTTFQVSGTIDLVAEDREYDLHNNFDFVGYEYSPTAKEARLSWRRGEGDWVPKDTPARLTLRFKGVTNLSVRRRDDEMPFTEDDCMASITFAPPEFADDFDSVFGGFRRADEHLAIVFQSGAALKIWAESVVHEIEP